MLERDVQHWEKLILHTNSKIGWKYMLRLAWLLHFPFLSQKARKNTAVFSTIENVYIITIAVIAVGWKLKVMSNLHQGECKYYNLWVVMVEDWTKFSIDLIACLKHINQMKVHFYFTKNSNYRFSERAIFVLIALNTSSMFSIWQTSCH